VINLEEFDKYMQTNERVHNRVRGALATVQVKILQAVAANDNRALAIAIGLAIKKGGEIAISSLGEFIAEKQGN
jgi:hypothetical protein